MERQHSSEAGIDNLQRNIDAMGRILGLDSMVNDNEDNIETRLEKLAKFISDIDVPSITSVEDLSGLGLALSNMEQSVPGICDSLGNPVLKSRLMALIRTTGALLREGVAKSYREAA